MATAKTITQRIAMTGGEDIRKELASLGAVGEAAFRKLQHAAEQLKGPGPTFVQRMNQIIESAKKAGAEYEKLGQKIQNVGQGVAFKASLPAGAALGGAVKSAATFEEAMTNVDIATGATGDQLNQLSETALKMGDQTRFSAKEAADAIASLGSMGVKTEDILGGTLKATLNLAESTGGGLQQSGILLTDVMTSFKKDAKDAPKVVDLINGALKESKLNFNEFANAVGQSAATAGTANVDLKDYVTLLAAMSPAYKSGESAGTATRNMLIGLTGRTKEAKELMQKLGIEAFDPTTGKMKSMTVIAGQLQGAMKKLNSDEAMLSNFKDIFGDDTLAGVALIGQKGPEAFTKLQNSIEKADAAADAFKRNATLVAAFDQLLGAFETLGIRIGKTGLLDILKEMVRGVTALVSAFANLPPPILAFTVAALATTAALGPLLIAIGGLVRLWGLYKVAQAAGALAILNGVKSVTAMSTALGVLRVGLVGLAAGFALPIAAAVALGAALVAAIAYMTGAWDGTLPSWQQVWTAIQNAWTAFLTLLRNAFNSFTSGIAGAWASVGSGWQAVWAGLSSAWTAFVNGLASIAQGILSGLSSAWDGIKAAWDTAWTAITSAWQAFVGGLKAVFDTASAGLSGAWQAIADAWAAVWDAITQKWSETATAIQNAWLNLQAFIESVIGAIKAKASEIWDGIVQAFNDAKAAVQSAWNDMVSWFDGIVSGIVARIQRIKAAVESAVSSLLRLIGLQDRAGEGGGNAAGGFPVPAFSRGGRVWGAGTSTSDSIPARLSAGEYVIRAKAVRKYGAALFAALNGMRISPDLLSGIRGFNMGGFVESLAGSMAMPAGPRLALAGSAVTRTQTPVVLNIGGESVKLVAQSASAVDQLHRISRRRGATSAGQKPDWY